MPLSAQEKAAIITVAGKWALKTVEEANTADLMSLVRDNDKYDHVTMTDSMLASCFIIHYNNLTSIFADKKK